MILIDLIPTNFGSILGSIVPLAFIVAAMGGTAQIIQKTVFGDGLSFVAGAIAGLGAGAKKGLSNYRSGKLAGRKQDFLEGSLARNNRAVAPLNAIGRRLGAASAGGGIHALLPTQRGRTARSLYGAQMGEGRLKRNALLAEGQNFDDANNVLGLSGGSNTGLKQAVEDMGWTKKRFDADGKAVMGANGKQIEDRDVAREQAAIAGAKAMGVNRGNAAAALKTSMANKARGIGAGNVRALDAGIRRLAKSPEEYSAFANQAAAIARQSGRADLGGTDWIDYHQSKDGNGAWAQAQRQFTGDEAAQWQYVADRTAQDGIGRTGVHAVMNGHTNQAKQMVQSSIRMLSSTNGKDRIQAAMTLKEFQGGLPGASADVRDVINKALYDPVRMEGSVNVGGLGLDSGHPTSSIADQLAGWANVQGFDGKALTTEARTYPEQTNPEATGQQPQNPPGP